MVFLYFWTKSIVGKSFYTAAQHTHTYKLYLSIYMSSYIYTHNIYILNRIETIERIYIVSYVYMKQASQNNTYSWSVRCSFLIHSKRWPAKLIAWCTNGSICRGRMCPLVRPAWWPWGSVPSMAPLRSPGLSAHAPTGMRPLCLLVPTLPSVMTVGISPLLLGIFYLWPHPGSASPGLWPERPDPWAC